MRLTPYDLKKGDSVGIAISRKQRPTYATHERYFTTAVLVSKVLLKKIPLSMLILGQKYYILGPIIIKTPYYRTDIIIYQERKLAHCVKPVVTRGGLFFEKEKKILLGWLALCFLTRSKK